MLNNQDKKYLRGLAQNLSPLVQIGKSGLSMNVYDTLDTALEAHELVKVNLLKTAPLETRKRPLNARPIRMPKSCI